MKYILALPIKLSRNILLFILGLIVLPLVATVGSIVLIVYLTLDFFYARKRLKILKQIVDKLESYE